MTREEAIDLLDNLIGCVEDNHGSDYDEALKIAIKALEREPCEDAISRQAVDTLVDELARAISDERGCISRGRSASTIMQDILDLPSVTPHRWIPVSERLPKDGQNVLFCDIDDDVMLGYHVKGRPNTHFTRDMIFENIKNVKAWMPLPEPYKAESEET